MVESPLVLVAKPNLYCILLSLGCLLWYCIKCQALKMEVEIRDAAAAADLKAYKYRLLPNPKELGSTFSLLYVNSIWGVLAALKVVEDFPVVP